VHSFLLDRRVRYGLNSLLLERKRTWFDIENNGKETLFP